MKQQTLEGQINDILQTSDASLASNAANSAAVETHDPCFEPIQETEFIEIKARRYSTLACDRWCKCDCHSRKSLSSPRLLDSFIGQLLIGYTGYITPGQKCTKLSCRLPSELHTQVTYRFPAWFLSWTVTAFVTKQRQKGPEMLLRVQRVRPYGTTDLFRFSTSGDIEQIHALFMSGQASPMDVQPDGRTALHVMITKPQNCSHWLTSVLVLGRNL